MLDAAADEIREAALLLWRVHRDGRLPRERPIAVELSGAVKGHRQAALFGFDGEVWGLELFHSKDGLVAVIAFGRGETAAPPRHDSIGVAFEHDGPHVYRYEEGRRVTPHPEDLVVLAAALRAIAGLSGGVRDCLAMAREGRDDGGAVWARARR